MLSIIEEQEKESFVKKTIFSIIYIFTFQYIYVFYLHKVWEYYGYELIDLSVIQMITTILIAYIPILFYRGIVRISSYFSILIYILAYVPITITLIDNSVNADYSLILKYQLLIMSGMILFFLADRIIFSTIINIQKTFKIQFKYIHILTAIITLYLLFYYKGSMHFVGFQDIYDLRDMNSEKGNGLTEYLIMWLTYCFYPLYLVKGLIDRDKLLIGVGVMGHILVYVIMGSKASITMPLIILIFYYVLKINSLYSFSQLFIIGIIILTILIFLGGDYMFLVASLFFMRTISMPGQLASIYVDFFTNHPYTYYSHLGFVNKLTGMYPYGSDPLGRAVVDGAYNANANFWVTDGIAALGPTGVIVINILFFFLLLFINKMFDQKISKFILLAFTPAIFALLNVSLFTTLLSCGMILLILILFVVDFDQEIDNSLI